MAQENPGIEFEKIVADIQSRIDSNAVVKHNQRIVDRHGHSRQFDVEIRGSFAGQDILGVIECKDLKKKVGTPEVDAFVTKSQDINANFRVLVSKSGFTKTAIEKSRHYGVQTLSLLPGDDVNYGFKVGSYWFADIYHWEQLALTVDFVDEPKDKVFFDVREVTLGGKRVLDWFTNYLIENHLYEDRVGWVVGLNLQFDNNQKVNVGGDREFVCKGFQFYAKRSLTKKRKFVGINGVGFLDWQKEKATFPPQEGLKSDAVTADFMDWEDRFSDEFEDSGFLNIKWIGHNSQFEYVKDAIDLWSL